MLNWDLLKNPLNWIIVMLMVLIAALALNFVLHWETTPNA